MRRHFLILLSALLCGLTVVASAWARPVSYPEGWTGLTMNDGRRNSLYVHYSPTADYSLGYKFEYWREAEYTVHALQINYLLERRNRRDSQASWYLRSGVGVAHGDRAGGDGDTTRTVAYTGVALDWESRRLYAAYHNRLTEAGDIDSSFRQSVRVGVAPYLGSYGDLHTWFMLDASHAPESDETLAVSPLIRFFKGTHLVEVGADQHGDLLFNWVARY